MKKRNITVCIVILCAMCFLSTYGARFYEEWKTAHSGIPDAVSSMRFNKDEHLVVVANSSEIKDKEAFARQVVHMCQEDSFGSMKLSSMPARLEVTVYLQRDAIGENDPVCKIEYIPLEYHDSYDIRNNMEKFHLYLDGEEIEFY